MKDIPVLIQSNATRLIPRSRLFIRKKALAYATEKTYIYWVLYYIRFHNRRHPEHMGAAEVEAFLSFLSIMCHASPSTQRTALNALNFLYRQFLQKPFNKPNFHLNRLSICRSSFMF
jgi:hypothetical protein